MKYLFWYFQFFSIFLYNQSFPMKPYQFFKIYKRFCKDREKTLKQQSMRKEKLRKVELCFIKPCSDERQNGFKSLKLKRCKFLQPSFTPCEHDCFCLRTLKYFRFKCLRRFLNFFWFVKTVLRTLKTSFKN